jgi:hypothetical protein
VEAKPDRLPAASRSRGQQLRLHDRKVLCSLGVGPHEELLDLAARSFRPYAARHGYDLALSTSLIEPQRPAAWNKVRFVSRLLDDYDVVFWIDADALLLQSDLDIADQLPEWAWLGMVAHQTPEAEEFPNSGVFVCRRTRTMRRFLADIWSSTQFLQHKWWENAAVLELMGYTVDPPVRLVHPTRYRKELFLLPNEWNSLPVLGQSNGRVRHYAAMSNAQRFAAMTADLAAAGIG